MDECRHNKAADDIISYLQQKLSKYIFETESTITDIITSTICFEFQGTNTNMCANCLERSRLTLIYDAYLAERKPSIAFHILKRDINHILEYDLDEDLDTYSSGDTKRCIRNATQDIQSPLNEFEVIFR